MDITLVIAIIGCIIGIISFFFNRKDKGEKDTQASSYKMGQIDQKLESISKQIDAISSKLDKYDLEIDKRIEKAINVHVATYHNSK